MMSMCLQQRGHDVAGSQALLCCMQQMSWCVDAYNACMRLTCLCQQSVFLPRTAGNVFTSRSSSGCCTAPTGAADSGVLSPSASFYT